MAITQHTLDKLSHFTLCPTTTITGTGDQTGVDIRSLDGEIQVILIGTAAGSSADLTFRLEDSADNSTFAAVTSGTFTAIGNAAYKEVKSFNASDLKRYIRLSCTAETGTASSAVTCVGYGTKQYEI
jgi:hypothetical protein